MPSVPGSVLIHRARRVFTVRAGAKDAQGERAAAETLGPWFPARFMTRRPGGEGAPEPGGGRRSVKPLSLIWGDEHEDGTLIDPPVASDVVEIEREVLGVLTTERFTVTGPPGDFDDGYGPFGGQAELARVVVGS
jgi:hypothetical protein